MLNKELLLVSPEKELEYTHTLRVGRVDKASYMYIGTDGGELLPNTVLINDSYIKIIALDSVYNTYTSLEYWRLLFITEWYTPPVNLYLGRTDTKEVIYYHGGDFETGHIEYTNNQGIDIKFTEEDVGKIIHLWIGTTPPPWA